MPKGPRNPFDDDAADVEKDSQKVFLESLPLPGASNSTNEDDENPFKDVLGPANTIKQNPFSMEFSTPIVVSSSTEQTSSSPPHRGASLDALLGAEKPRLPPRPVLSENQAPPLPSRPIGIASKKSTLFYSSNPESLAATRSSPPSSSQQQDRQQKTLHHQPSLERFNALKIKDVILYPQTKNVGRKPPISRECHFPLIQHRGSVRALAVSQQFVVTCTANVRVWDLATGENSKTVILGGDAKPTAVSFVPSLQLLAPEQFIWVGLDNGEILEIHIPEGRIGARRSLHSSSILHILRYRELNLVTIDEQGALKIWTEWDSRGIVSLSGRPKGLRVNPRLSVVFLYDDQLWLGAGKHIEVYNLAPDALTVLQKKLELSSNYGNVTCMTVIRQQTLVFVYTGHDDGKLIEWDPHVFERKRVFQLGIYRVTSLFGLESPLIWVGFLTGKISIYDLSIDEASLVKEFQAHPGSGVASLTLDQKSALRLGSSHLLSSSENGEIRVWDALLIQDWIDSFVREREKNFCMYHPINIEICSWNIDSRKSSDLEAVDTNFIEKWIWSESKPDMIVVGFQELVDLELKNVAAKSFLSMKSSKQDTSSEQRFILWQDYLKRAIQSIFPDQSYVMIDCRSMVGLFQILFVTDYLSVRISGLESTSIKTGLGGYHGNKGALSTRFLVDDSSFCFVNAHLAAHQSHVSQRNNDIASIVKDAAFRTDVPDFCFQKGADGSCFLDHENCFFYGDLNYRIDLPRSKVLDLIERSDWRTLQESDQLLTQLSQNVSFGLRFFSEGLLNFSPTFKYDRGSNSYDSSDKMRVPAWCDRVLFKGEALALQTYSRFEHQMSDHRPIRATFLAVTKTIKKPELLKIQELAVQTLETYTRDQLEARLSHWVSHASRLPYDLAREQLQKCNWDIESLIIDL